MKTVSDFLRSIHMYTGSSGFNMVGHSDGLLSAVNFALTQIYFRKTRLRHRQLRSERFQMKGWGDNYTLNTKHPIIKIAGLYDAPYNPITIVSTSDGCGEACIPEEPSCGCDSVGNCTSCECGVCVARGKIIGTEVAPGAYLDQGMYSISGGSGGGGTFGNIISYKPTTCLDEHAVYVLYYSGFNELTCVEDTIDVPHYYLAPLAYLVVGFTISRYGNYRVGDDKFYLTEGLSLLDEIDSYNNHTPNFIASK